MEMVELALKASEILCTYANERAQNEQKFSDLPRGNKSRVVAQVKSQAEKSREKPRNSPRDIPNSIFEVVTRILIFNFRVSK